MWKLLASTLALLVLSVVLIRWLDSLGPPWRGDASDIWFLVWIFAVFHGAAFLARTARRRAQARPATPRYLCAGCSNVVPRERIHVVPCFLPAKGDYEMGLRCNDCCVSSLDATQAQLLANIHWENERRRFARCFERVGILGLSVSNADRLRAQALRILDAIRSGKAVLAVPGGSSAGSR